MTMRHVISWFFPTDGYTFSRKKSSPFWPLPIFTQGSHALHRFHTSVAAHVWPTAERRVALEAWPPRFGPLPLQVFWVFLEDGHHWEFFLAFFN